MATELEERCPICLDSWEEASYVMPCHHQFCYPCILRWAESKPECPLCKRRIVSIVHSVQADDDFEEELIPAARAPPAVVPQEAGGAPGHPAAHSPAAAQQQQQPVPGVPRAPLGGLQPRTWASLFRDHPALLQLLLPWVRQELGMIFGSRRALADVVEDLLIPLLVLFGLDEDLLVQLLGASLQSHAATFVRQLIDVVVRRCSLEAHRLLGLEEPRAAGAREGSPGPAPRPAAPHGGSPAPGPAPSDSLAAAEQEEPASASAAALPQGPRSAPDAPVPPHGEQEEPREDAGQAGAGPSAPSRDRDHPLRGQRRAPKRSASGCQPPAQPPKRPPRPC